MTEQEKRLIRIATACMLLLVLVAVAAVVFLSVELKKRGHIDITYQTITNDNFDPKKLTEEQKQQIADKLDIPTPQNGKNGRDGRDGKDSLSTNTTIVKEVPIPGKDGYTPIKGVDYFDGERGSDGAPGVVVYVRENPKTKDLECRRGDDIQWFPIEECSQ